MVGCCNRVLGGGGAGECYSIQGFVVLFFTLVGVSFYVASCTL